MRRCLLFIFWSSCALAQVITGGATLSDSSIVPFVSGCGPSNGYSCFLTQSNANLTVIPLLATTPNFGNLSGRNTTLTPSDFFTTITRCTDAHSADGIVAWGPMSTHSFDLTYGGGGGESQINSDGTLLAAVATATGSFVVVNVDPVGKTCSTAISGFNKGNPGQWDLTNPKLLYQISGTQVTKWDFTNSPPTQSLLFDFAQKCTGLPAGKPTWIGTMGLDNIGIFSDGFSYTGGQNTGNWVCAFQPSTGKFELYNTLTQKITGTLSTGGTTTMFPFTLHDTGTSEGGGSELELAVGNTCTGCPSAHGPVLWSPLNGTNVGFITVDVGGHNAIGISHYINIVNSPATAIRPFTALNSPVTLATAQNVKLPSNGETHMSWQHTTDDTQPVFLSTITQPCTSITQPLQCEFFGEITAGPNMGQFIRVAHLYSSGLFNKINFRASNVICAMAPTGVYAACSSDMNNTLGAFDAVTSTCNPGGINWKAGDTATVGKVIFGTANNGSGPTLAYTFQITNAGSGTLAPTQPNWNSSCPSTGNLCTDSNGVVFRNLGPANCRNDIFLVWLTK